MRETSQTMPYAVVIPAYNEEATIYAVAQQSLKHLKQCDRD